VKMDLKKVSAANRGHFPARPKVTQGVPTGTAK
jgi:hypothetical protein